jgi:hypothetical protein
VAGLARLACAGLKGTAADSDVAFSYAQDSNLDYLAVEVGFEPTEPLSSHAFKARPFGRFGTPPLSIIPLRSRCGGAARSARLRTVAKFPAEASPSPVYGAGLLIPLGGNPLASSNLAASAPQPHRE